MKQGLALFDFDGTLTTKDSLLEFIRFTKGSATLYLVMVLFAPIILYYKLIKKDGEQAKRMVLSFLYKGKMETELRALGDSFSQKLIPGIIRTETMDALRDMKKHGYRVIVISASISIWLKPWAEEQDVELICTEFEFQSGIFTGRFSTPNCNGDEKVNRIKEHLNIMDFSPIYAYGNSSGDLPMLGLADYAFMNNEPFNRG